MSFLFIKHTLSLFKDFNGIVRTSASNSLLSSMDNNASKLHGLSLIYSNDNSLHLAKSAVSKMNKKLKTYTRK